MHFLNHELSGFVINTMWVLVKQIYFFSMYWSSFDSLEITCSLKVWNNWSLEQPEPERGLGEQDCVALAACVLSYELFYLNFLLSEINFWVFNNFQQVLSG